MGSHAVLRNRGGLLKGRHHKAPAAGKLNLVSLMDIFTILVFFLMVNSSDVQVLQQNPSIELPESVAEQPPAESLLVLITDSDLLVQGKSIASLPLPKGQVDSGPDNPEVIPALKAELMFHAKREEWGQLEMPEKEDKSLPVTIMGDSTVPYSLLKRIMATCSETPYRDVSLAVRRLFKTGAA